MRWLKYLSSHHKLKSLMRREDLKVTGYILGRFSNSFDKGENFHDLLFAFLNTKSFLKTVYAKRKDLALEANSFLLEYIS